MSEPVAGRVGDGKAVAGAHVGTHIGALGRCMGWCGGSGALLCVVSRIAPPVRVTYRAALAPVSLVYDRVARGRVFLF